MIIILKVGKLDAIRLGLTGPVSTEVPANQKRREVDLPVLYEEFIQNNCSWSGRGRDASTRGRGRRGERREAREAGARRKNKTILYELL